jgi:hypothetical protein
MSPRSTLHSLPVPTALEVIGEHFAEQAAFNAKLTEGLSGIEKQLERMNVRLERHDRLRAWLGKIGLAVATAIAIGAVGVLFRISLMVQAARLPGG